MSDGSCRTCAVDGFRRKIKLLMGDNLFEQVRISTPFLRGPAYGEDIAYSLEGEVM